MGSGKIFILSAAAFAVASAVLWAQSSAGSTTQGFEAARHVLLNGEAIVSYVMNSGGRGNQQPVIVKMDTKTGQCWILQIAVNSPHDPTVQSAVWAPVQLNAVFQPHGGGNND